MSHNTLRFEGMAELRAALRQLPRELATEASGIVNRKAAEARAEISDAYPSRTGNLRKGLAVVSAAPASAFGATAIVRNSAKHAYLFEVGTQARHTAIGANRGSMPPGRVFIPIIVRKRREMFEDLSTMLATHGLTVYGVAA